MRNLSDISESLTGMVCDTPVPYYEVGVSCGLPGEMGDLPPEMILLPSLMTRGRRVFIVDADGDSMQGVGIYSGDMLLMESTRRVQSGEVVMVDIDGEEVLKTYYVDDDKRHWLLPANDKYKPIEMTEDMNVHFCGRLICNLSTPHDSISHIREQIRRFKETQQTLSDVPRVPTREEVKTALIAVGPTIKKMRHWLGACRVLMDSGFIPQEHYDQFCKLVARVLPGHGCLPKSDELNRMATGCFAKPFATWTDEKAPVHGKYYLGYYDAGLEMTKNLT